jgi:hypothetical protein
MNSEYLFNGIRLFTNALYFYGPSIAMKFSEEERLTKTPAESEHLLEYLYTMEGIFPYLLHYSKLSYSISPIISY